ncbi:hypothetical protein ABT186_43655 [Streptomyces sp. NPDC001634]|uniref:hypothetical protein n=1 Tax=Streptomyces sp. NPDC001634 TaxID=3154390 RepID=UPI00332B0FBC
MVGVAQFATAEVEEVEAVGGRGVAGSGRGLPPPLGAVMGFGEVEQAGEVQGASTAAGSLLVLHVDTLDKDSVAAPMQRVIFTTPNLLASYLEKQQHMQYVIVAALSERAAAAGTPHPAEDPTLRAVTAAAFGCLNAGQQAWRKSGTSGTFAAALDTAMAAVAPQARL